MFGTAESVLVREVSCIQSVLSFSGEVPLYMWVFHFATQALLKHMFFYFFCLPRYGLQCVGILLPLLTLTWVVASLYVGLGSSVLGFIYLILIVITVSGRPTR